LSGGRIDQRVGHRGVPDMWRRLIEQGGGGQGLDRRRFLRRAVVGASVFGCLDRIVGPALFADEPRLSPAEEAERELERAQSLARVATRSPLITMRSEQFQGVGDASESFLKLTLGDCENIAEDYFGYYQGQGFDIRRPARRLTIVVFRDERPYLEFARKSARGVTPFDWGFYSRAENWLVLFDFRNVPASEHGAGYKNVRVLAHEATHQLTFNSGLLNRQGDLPRAIAEGLASYSETRPLHGHGEPGKLNLSLLDDLAHIRRRAKWIRATDLLTDDTAAFGNTLDQRLLAYAQGWLLVYYLMKTPARLHQLQAYLKRIATRTTKDHRYDDAERHFGDLDRLDQELRREAIQLQLNRH
jgi:Protein of unknown function (DUF1570)